jgi:alkanesulfonate monooxygenase SsuD/methylene tetrahydromethanopterin reductase-like flavin-dependent oxidoreductase (luciferase family)
LKVSLGLPIVMKGLDPSLFVEWARRSEAAGFSAVGTLGRVVFDSHEELIVLSAVAAVTTRLRMATTVLIGPPRQSVLLAKQAATLHNLSGGRFTLGLGTGWREEDYLAMGVEFASRGDLLDAQIQTIRKIWNGDTLDVDEAIRSTGPSRSYMVHHPGAAIGPVGPTVVPPGGPELMLGGSEGRSLARIGCYADAFMTGPLPASEPVQGAAKTVRDVYDEVRRHAECAGRPAPRLVTSNYVALGATDEEASARLRDYYAIGGEGRYEWPMSRTLRTAADVRAHLDSMAAIDVDECFLWPTVANFKQIELVACAASPYID